MILEQCKGMHCVDLGESFQTHIYLQNLVSIQPRTSLVKFALSSSPGAPGNFLLEAHQQTLEGSFSAVSKPNFASKYAFESS